ncbi:MAG: MotA/TolQ/ExbB proton channel family protein [Candidatus Krumholzibacteriota bacterium]|nr:MotA/TolQ/ExbB proton channel family protein [Candidatus Krumholzibacteriota bacterium]
MFTDFNWLEAVRSSPILIILIACSILALGVALERVAYFWRRRGNPRTVLARILDQVRRGAVKEAMWTAESSAHPLGAAAAAMLANRGAPEAELEERLHIALSEEKLLLDKNMAILGTMAAVAPLVGLLGTVYGIMMAFHDMGVTGSSSPSVVAAGVAEALLTTGAGLVVAVPSLVLFNHFARKTNVMLTLAENGARVVRASLARSAAPSDAVATARDELGDLERLAEMASDRSKIPVTQDA